MSALSIILAIAAIGTHAPHAPTSAPLTPRAHGRVTFYVPAHATATDTSTTRYLAYVRVDGHRARMVDSQTNPHEVFGIAGVTFDGVTITNRSGRRLRVTARIVRATYP